MPANKIARFSVVLAVLGLGVGYAQEPPLPRFAEPGAPLPALDQIQPVLGDGQLGEPEPVPAEAVLEPIPHRGTSIAVLEQLALQNNPTVQQAAHAAEALRGKYVQVGLRPNPEVGYVGEEINDEGTLGQQGAFFSQKFITGGKLHLNRNVVGHEIAAAEFAWQAQSMRVTNDVRAAAYRVLAAQRKAELIGELVRIGAEGRKAAEDLLRAKEVSKVDVLQARVEENSARMELENAQKDYLAKWREMAVTVGMPDLETAPITDRLTSDLPELTWEQSVAQLLENSPELARAYAQIERANCDVARQCAGQVPDFDVEAAVRHNLASDETVASVRVGVPLQLFDSNQGNIHRAQAELTAAHQEARRVELELQKRLAGAFNQYAVAKTRAERYKKSILPDAGASLELLRDGYRQGEYSYLDLLTAQRTFFRVNLAYVESLRDVWISSVAIDGLLLTGGLDAAP